MKYLYWIFSLVFLVTVGCVDRDQQKQAKKTSELLNDTTIPVTVEPATSRTLSEKLIITGQVATSEIASVGAKMSGKITAVFVRDGDPVRAGQLIASQDTSSLALTLRQASAQASQARSTLQQALSNKAIGPSKSASAVASAQAAVRAARSQLDKAKNGARSEEVRQAESAAAGAKSAMETAKKEWERQQYMQKEGAASQQAVENAENLYRNALANYESALEQVRMKQSWTRPEDIRFAEEQLRQAEEQLRTAKSQQKLDVLFDQQVDAARATVRAAEAQVDIARKNISDAQITSPFSGRVSGQPLQPGSFAGPGTVVAKVVGEGNVYFEGQIPESNINSIQIGDPVIIELDAMKGKLFNGTLAAIDPLGDDVGRLYKARIQIESPSSYVRPGMFARGTVNQNEISNAVVVPSTAVIRDGDKAYVFLFENGKAKKTLVSLGLNDEGVIQVKGISPGAKVIVRGQTQLVEGSKVKLEDLTPADSNETKASVK